MRSNHPSSLLAQYVADVSNVVSQLPNEALENVAEILLDAWQRRSCIYVGGNGGSAAIASHFVGDLNKGTNIAGRHRFRAIALVDNIPALMAWSNDVSYEASMVEQLRNFVEVGDVVIGISGSGNSVNVLRAIELGKQVGAQTIGFCGFDGGQLKRLADVIVHVPCHKMEQVEDAFSVICHALLFGLRARIRQEPLAVERLLASSEDAYRE